MSIEWIDHAHFGTLTLSNCDKEPIRIPGLIQSQGFMLIADPGTSNIVSFSANVPIIYDIPDWYERELNLSDFFEPDELAQIEQFCAPVAQVPNLENFGKEIAGQAYEVTAINTDEHWIIEAIQSPESPENLLEINNSVAAAITEFSLTSTELEACEKAAALVRKMTNYDRVMVYRFDPKWNGTVLVESAAENLDNRFLHMHFPHTDIPVQARQLYLETKTRVLMDVNAETIPLVPQTDPLNDEPFDMRLAHLRAVSPVHIEYLQNMDVRATLVISIVVDDQLWGLIACHDYTGGRRVSIPTRRACQCVADLLASTISRLSAREFNRGIEIANRIAEKIRISDRQPGGVHAILKQYREDLRGLFDAQGIGWRIGQDKFSDGLEVAPKDIQEARKFSKDGVLIFDAFPEILGDEVEDPEVGGIVLISVSNEGSDYLYMTRCIESRTIPWGGNPDTMLKVAADSNTVAVLTPRKSFELWEESIRGRSSEFEMLHFQIANILRNVIVEAYLEEERLRSANTLEEQKKRNRITGLPNRRALVETLNGLDEQNPDEPIAVILVEIEDFDQLVNNLGQDASEQLLVQVANNLREIGNGGSVAHLEKGQFALLAHLATATESAEALARKTLLTVSSAYMVADEVIHLPCFAAYAERTNRETGAERTLINAEITLPLLRKGGSGRLLGYSDEIRRSADREKALESELRVAASENQIEHHYQPIVDTRTGAIIGAEALMRWRHPDGAIHHPREFIPTLSRMNMLAKIDKQLIDGVLGQFSSLTKIRPDFFISFNLGRDMFERKNSQMLDDLLRRMEPHAKNIAFELTESQVTAFPEESLLSIQKMRHDGFQVFLDEFGTGQSSLAFLNDAPITGVKIDKRFIRGIEQDKTLKLIESMRDIAISLDLKTVYIGVEKSAQAVKLGVKECFLQQGSYYFEALPWEELRKKVKANRKK